MLNYTPKYEVLCSSNATWQHQGTEAVSGGLEDPAGWLGKAAGDRWASSNGQRAWKWAGFICEMFLDYFFIFRFQTQTSGGKRVLMCLQC